MTIAEGHPFGYTTKTYNASPHHEICNIKEEKLAMDQVSAFLTSSHQANGAWKKASE